MGYARADYFAKLGALSAKLPDGHGLFYKQYLSDSQQYAKYLAWAVQWSAMLELWSERAAKTDAPGRPPRAARRGPTLALHEHDLVELQGRLFCCRCRRPATTAASRRQLEGGTGRFCKPSLVSRLQASLLEAAASSACGPPAVLGAGVVHTDFADSCEICGA